MKFKTNKKFYRTIWISDTHLGTSGCKSKMLLEFLEETDSEYLFLVGDIVDGWRMRKKMYWPQEHNDVVQKVLKKAKNGTRVVLIPGNHDEVLKDFTNFSFGEISIKNEDTHQLADGRKVLITHGDEFDAVIINARWLAKVGSALYEYLLKLNNVFNFIRRKMGLSYWSLSQYLKKKTKHATNFISNFEFAVSDRARRENADVVVCGHIHRPEIKELNGVLYCNDGDWIESCTALVEDEIGNLSILNWPEEREKLKLISLEERRKIKEDAA